MPLPRGEVAAKLTERVNNPPLLADAGALPRESRLNCSTKDGVINCIHSHHRTTFFLCLKENPHNSGNLKRGRMPSFFYFVSHDKIKRKIYTLGVDEEKNLKENALL